MRVCFHEEDVHSDFIDTDMVLFWLGVRNPNMLHPAHTHSKATVRLFLFLFPAFCFVWFWFPFPFNSFFVASVPDSQGRSSSSDVTTATTTTTVCTVSFFFHFPASFLSSSSSSFSPSRVFLVFPPFPHFNPRAMISSSSLSPCRDCKCRVRYSSVCSVCA